MKDKENILPGDSSNQLDDDHKNIQSNSGNDLVDNLKSSEFLKGKRGLVVDFDENGIIITSHMLKKLGAEVESTQDANLAIDIVRKGNIDFVIISPYFYKDLGNRISEEDFDFLANIQEEYNEIPIFAYTTAFTGLEQLNELKLFPFVDILNKPISNDKVFNLSLKKHLRPDLPKD